VLTVQRSYPEFTCLVESAWGPRYFETGLSAPESAGLRAASAIQYICVDRRALWAEQTAVLVSEISRAFETCRRRGRQDAAEPMPAGCRSDCCKSYNWIKAGQAWGLPARSEYFAFLPTRRTSHLRCFIHAVQWTVVRQSGSSMIMPV